MNTRPIPESAKEQLARFEELVAKAYHAPIGQISETDISGWYGVRFSVGGHDFIVYQTLDRAPDLGLDMTCQWRDGHEDCEGQYEILRGGFHYVNRLSDDRVVAFIRRAVARRFTPPFQMIEDYV